MNELVHADIFFFITSVAVVVVSIGMLIALYFIIQIVRDVRAIVAKLRKAGDDLERDLTELRAQVRNEGGKVKTLFEAGVAFLSHRLRTRTRRKKTEDAV